MALLEDILWLETFLLSTLMIGALSGIVLLVGKYPSGRWLGMMILSCSGAIVIRQLALVAFLPTSIVAILVASYLYLSAFFYQKSRVSFWHYSAVLLALINSL